MKHILFLSSFLLLFFACCKTKTTTPTAEQSQYFNAYIDGKYWTYTQASFTNTKGIGAGKSGLLYYGLTGTDMLGYPSTYINILIAGGNSFPSKDTFDLGNYHYAEIHDLYKIIIGQPSSYKTDNTNIGKLIFTKRSEHLLEGTFYFDVYDTYNNKTIHITNGKFSIIPSN